jgi:hypothetical protein
MEILTYFANNIPRSCVSIEGKSAASFCHLVAAKVADMFCYFYLLKNHKIANNLTTTTAREKKQAQILNP